MGGGTVGEGGGAGDTHHGGREDLKLLPDRVECLPHQVVEVGLAREPGDDRQPGPPIHRLAQWLQWHFGLHLVQQVRVRPAVVARCNANRACARVRMLAQLAALDAHTPSSGTLPFSKALGPTHSRPLSRVTPSHHGVTRQALSAASSVTWRAAQRNAPIGELGRNDRP